MCLGKVGDDVIRSYVISGNLRYIFYTLSWDPFNQLTIVRNIPIWNCVGSALNVKQIILLLTLEFRQQEKMSEVIHVLASARRVKGFAPKMSTASWPYSGPVESYTCNSQKNERTSNKQIPCNWSVRSEVFPVESVDVLWPHLCRPQHFVWGKK